MRVVCRVAAVATACVIVAACDESDHRTESGYCGQVAANLAELNSPVIADGADIGRVLQAWRSVADAAPIAIDQEWAVMVEMLETAITVDPDDPESLQKVSDTARAAEPESERVISYTQQRCGLTIGLSP